MEMSICFHRRSVLKTTWRDLGATSWFTRVTAWSTPNTVLASLLLSCSVMLVMRWARDRQQRSREGSDPGPRTELEYWRSRTQRITSITEQLKSKDAKTVFGVLHAVTRVNQDVAPKSRQVVFNTLRRWKQIDISITEAFNEARDNVKYLATLEKFIEPLYTGTPGTIID